MLAIYCSTISTPILLFLCSFCIGTRKLPSHMQQTNFNSFPFPAVPPEVTLTCNSNWTAVCKAAAGKPAAWISWDPNGDARNQSETHTNGTKTVLSTYTISSPKETNITCVVSHLAGNTSQSKECPSGNSTHLFSLYSLHL